MPCKDVMDRLEPFLDGELGVEVTVRMLAHLERCRPCRARAGFDEGLRATVVSACRARLDPTRYEELLDRACGCRGRTSRLRGRLLLVVLLLGGAAVALLVASRG